VQGVLIRAWLELLVPSVCPGCDAARRGGDPPLCAACARELAPANALGGVATALVYAGLGARLVQRFKYLGRSDARAVLVELLAARAAELRFDVVVPLPRHPERIRALGRDPVHDLARELARRAGRRLAGSALRRVRETRSQTGLSIAERRANVAGAFAAAPEALRGLRALLVDDVVTTGATLRSAAAALDGASGARSVIPLAVAGTPLPGPAGPVL
jgi:predicted amidophosphoribosyltransferase